MGWERRKGKCSLFSPLFAISSSAGCAKAGEIVKAASSGIVASGGGREREQKTDFHHLALQRWDLLVPFVCRDDGTPHGFVGFLLELRLLPALLRWTPTVGHIQG